MWSINTIEAELPEGVHEFVVPRREGEEQALVLVEQVDGEPGQMEAEVGNIPGAQLSRYAKAKVFMGRFADGAGDITLKVYVKTARLVRITIATLRSGLRSSLKSLPCRLCKKLVSLLLSTGLAMLGIPYMDAPVVFDDDLVADLGALAANPSLATFAELVREVDLGIWEAILAGLAGVEFIFEFADKVYEKVCRAIGMCPKVA